MVVACVSAALAVGVSYGSLTAYAAWSGDRPIHGVSYLGASLGQLPRADRLQRIAAAQAAFLDRTLRITVDDTTLFLPVREFAPTFDVDRVIVQSEAIGHEAATWDRTRSIVTSLWSGTILDPALALTTIPVALGQAIEQARHSSVDASFAWEAARLTVRSHQLGQELESATVLNDALRSALSGDPLVLPIRSQPPAITTDMLTPLIPKAQAVIATPVTLISGAKTVTYQSDELVSWLAPTVGLDGLVELNFDQTAIAADLVRIEGLVNRSASPRQLSARDGSLLNPGKPGTVVDREATVAALVAVLTARNAGADSRPIPVTTRTLEPVEQTVEPDTTPGLYQGRYLEVDLSGQQLYQYDGETLVGHYRVSTGKWSTPTPIGTFAINSKVSRAYSRPYDLYMPYWMAFLGSSYGLHELPEWSDGRKEGEGHLGTPVSHGCIRLGIGDAQSIYDWVEVGTPVVVHK